jgi:hypothetical protein
MSDRSGWMHAEAVVDSEYKKWRFRPNVSPNGYSEEKRVAFSYMVSGHRYSGEFTGNMKKGEVFPLLYNPSNPKENDKVDFAQKFSDFTGSFWNRIAVIGGIALVMLLYDFLRGKF